MSLNEIGVGRSRFYPDTALSQTLIIKKAKFTED